MDNIRKQWLYPSSIEEAIRSQIEMAGQITLEDCSTSPSLVCGMDVSNTPFDPNKMIYASCVLLSGSNLCLLERSSTAVKELFPYIPGLLGFREAPPLIQAYQALKQKPDLIMVDGHGISHPRGLGIASQIGLLLDCPTIGVAKSILVGAPEGALGEDVGSEIPLKWKGETIAMLVRTKKRCNPLIVSAGHKISLKSSVELVLQSCRGYRLPEPTRQAHLGANKERIEVSSAFSI